MSKVIETAGLRKSFGTTVALDGLDLVIREGQIHGLLGPNGAGKSTTLRILLGLLRADSGTTLLFGRDPWREAVELHRQLADVPGDVTLWPNLTGGEALDLLGHLRGGLDPQCRAEGAAEAIPATWVRVAASAALTGWSPQRAPWAWGVLGLAYVLGEFGTTMNLPDCLIRVSPCADVDAYPLGDWDGGNVVVLSLLFAGPLAGVGAVLHRRRDIG